MKTINIIDNQFAHGTSFGAGDLEIYPDHFKWDRSLRSSNKYTFITEDSFKNISRNKETGDIYVSLSFMHEKKYDNLIALILEPKSINPKSYEFIKEHHNKFSHVLSYDIEFNKTIPNSLYYPYGGCWIKPEDRKVYPKTKFMSIIASGKKETEGHRLRHEFIERYAELYGIDVFGRGYKTVDNKLEALKDYMFSVVIENEKSDGWFTEKLIDCYQTGTIPVYWGAKDIDNYTASIDYKINNIVDHCLLDRLKMKFNKSLTDLKKEINIENKFIFYDIEKTLYCFKESKKYTLPENWIYQNYPFLFE